MELNLFKHHYFVTVSIREYTFSVGHRYMFIHCRAKDVYKTILNEFAEGAEVGIDTITKLD